MEGGEVVAVVVDWFERRTIDAQHHLGRIEGEEEKRSEVYQILLRERKKEDEEAKHNTGS